MYIKRFTSLFIYSKTCCIDTHKHNPVIKKMNMRYMSMHITRPHPYFFHVIEALIYNVSTVIE